MWVTIAGSAARSGSDDGTNDLARFNLPTGIAIDESSNIFIADTANHTIRKASPVSNIWVVTTIAGRPGLSGSADGTNATARFNEPSSIALGQSGSLFIADSRNHTIRKITPDGANWVVTTIAGWPQTNGFRDGTNRVARFNQPLGIAADKAGTLYVADTSNETIRQVKPLGTNWIVKTIAGSPLQWGRTDGILAGARFHQPAGIAIDSAGNVYVTDNFNSTIRQLRPFGSNWITTTIAGFAGYPGSADGPGISARFGNPYGISIDASNNLFVTDSIYNNVRKICPVGTNWIVKTWGGSAGTHGDNDAAGWNARFYSPRGIAVNATGTAYYVADSLNNTIREGGSSLTVTKIFPGTWVPSGVYSTVGRPAQK